jgi:hypothetical protein
MVLSRFDLFVLFFFIYLTRYHSFSIPLFTMKARTPKSRKAKIKSAPTAESNNADLPPKLTAESEVPPPEAFLEEAQKEPKRKLIGDHSRTIWHLRMEKRFTFRAIADWLNARGIEADHSSVYRAFLASIPEDQRDPREDWSEVDQPE